MSRRAALGLLAAGGITLGTQQSGAFSSVDAGRGFGVGSAEDPEALLGIENAADPDEDPVITNNSEFILAVTLDPKNGDSGFGRVEADILPGNERTIDPEKLGGGETGEIEVDITAELFENEDGSRGVRVGEIELERTFAVPDDGPIQLVTGTVSNTGKSGFVEFKLENRTEDEVTIDGFRVPETEPETDRIEPPGNQPTLEKRRFDEENEESGDGETIIDEPMHVGPDVEFTDVHQDVENVVFGGGEEIEFKFRRFVSPPGKGGTEIDSFDLEIRFKSGSTSRIELT